MRRPETGRLTENLVAQSVCSPEYLSDDSTHPVLLREGTASLGCVAAQTNALPSNAFD